MTEREIALALALMVNSLIAIAVSIRNIQYWLILKRLGYFDRE